MKKLFFLSMVMLGMALMTALSVTMSKKLDAKKAAASNPLHKAFESGARENLYVSAKKGDALAQYYLGRLYLRDNMAAKQFDQSASNGGISIYESYELTQIQIRGNAEQAVKWLDKAIAQGHAGARYELGRMTTAGHGMRADEFKGTALIYEAAQQGWPDAQSDIGDFYADSRRLAPPPAGQPAPLWYRKYAEHEYDKALAWYIKAAEQGNKHAQLRLVKMYEVGLGTPRDFAKAEHWRRRASEQK